MYQVVDYNSVTHLGTYYSYNTEEGWPAYELPYQDDGKD